MTLDEAIKHSRVKSGHPLAPKTECQEEHYQLALWLEELKELRKFKERVRREGY